MSLNYKKARELAKNGTRPIRIAAELGFRVSFEPFEELIGLSLSLGTNKFIMINSGLSEAEQEFVCGNQLGHFLLYPSTNIISILHKAFLCNNQGYQANHFSCELILGEKAAEYAVQISEAAASNDLEVMVELIYSLVREEYLCENN